MGKWVMLNTRIYEREGELIKRLKNNYIPFKCDTIL